MNRDDEFNINFCLTKISDLMIFFLNVGCPKKNCGCYKFIDKFNENWFLKKQ